MSMLIDLRDAQPDSAGPKAGVLGRLLRSGFPVPPGFVIPISVYAEVARGLGFAAEPEPAQARSALLRASIPPELTAQVTERLRLLAVESGTTHVGLRLISLLASPISRSCSSPSSASPSSTISVNRRTSSGP